MSDLPLLAKILVHLGQRRAWREPLLGDLEEMFHQHLADGLGRGQARRRVVVEAARSALDTWWRRGLGSAGLEPVRPEVVSVAGGTGRNVSTPGVRSKPHASGDSTMTAWFAELNYAARGLRRAPGFTFVVVSTLALGLGCLTAFWSLLDSVLLRPLPFAESERLVQLWGERVDAPGGRYNSSYPDYLDFRAETDIVSELAVYQSTFANLLDGTSPPERVPTTFVSHDFFDTLAMPPVHGRDFEIDDDRPGAVPTVVLGATLWRQRFGSDPDILGRSIRVDGVPRVIVGVAAEGLDFPNPTDLWVPVNALSGTEVRGVHNLQVVGRLAPGVDEGLAQQALSQVAARLRAEYPRSNAQLGVRVEALHTSLVGPVQTRLLLVAAAAGFLLLVVCANISSLLLERITRRQRDVATRAALGASHGQLLRGFAAEASLLVGAGGAAALGVAVVVQRLLLEFGPPLPRQVAPGLDLRAFVFALGVALVLAALFVVVPGFHALGRNLFRRLAVGVVGSEGLRGRRWRAGFVIAQVAVAVILTLGAGLLVQSLDRLYGVDLGFETEGILTLDLEFSTPFVSDEWPKTLDFYERLIERLEATPGVASVAAAHHHPANPGWSTSFRVDGAPPPAPGFSPEAGFRPVSLGYFETVGIPVLQGQVFDQRTRSEAPGQVVVNQAFVDRYLPEGDPVGRKILRDSWWIDEIEDYTVLGVVANTRFAGRNRPAAPAMYLPHRQDVTPMMTVLVRAEPGIDPTSLTPTVQRAVWDVDPEMALGSMSTLEGLVADTVSVQRFVTGLLSAFASITLALAALGLYGALAFATARRTRELGLRMALGAGTRRLWGMVLGDGLKLASLGVVLGVVGAWFSSRSLEALLFGIEHGDPTTFAGVVALLGVVALAAALVPAWRASRIDPCRALADE